MTINPTSKQKQALESLKQAVWAIVDSNNNIIETFRYSTTARDWKWKLQKQQLCKLEIKKLPLE